MPEDDRARTPADVPVPEMEWHLSLALGRGGTFDNGRVEQSTNAFYGRDGKWLVENHGADPDVVQDNDPASAMAGKDLQLEKAVEVALQKIKDQPWQFPAVPAYPER
jgi:tricorn protease